MNAKKLIQASFSNSGMKFLRMYELEGCVTFLFIILPYITAIELTLRKQLIFFYHLNQIQHRSVT